VDKVQDWKATDQMVRLEKQQDRAKRRRAPTTAAFPYARRFFQLY